jgi:hypothetical protein
MEMSLNQQTSIPSGFIRDEFERDFTYADDEIAKVWRRLQLRETFTKGQLFPYRVEFASGFSEGEFIPGELCWSQLSFPGSNPSATPRVKGQLMDGLTLIAPRRKG